MSALPRIIEATQAAVAAKLQEYRPGDVIIDRAAGEVYGIGLDAAGLRVFRDDPLALIAALTTQAAALEALTYYLSLSATATVAAAALVVDYTIVVRNGATPPVAAPAQALVTWTRTAGAGNITPALDGASPAGSRLLATDGLAGANGWAIVQCVSTGAILQLTADAAWTGNIQITPLGSPLGAGVFVDNGRVLA